MKNYKGEICSKCGKERPIDPRKHLCHQCWQEEKEEDDTSVGNVTKNIIYRI